MTDAVLGVDVGTSSTKGVLVGLDGRVIASTVREHTVERPHLGHAEMSAALWWDEFCDIARSVVAGHDIVAVGVSGMGPCVAITDDDGKPLRPAILYGIDTRATQQIDAMNRELGIEQIRRIGGSALSTQAVGPKLRWLSEREPDIAARARRLFMPASWLAWNLTGAYVLDHQSASQCTPLYDTDALQWHDVWARSIAGKIELPSLVWADDVVGTVSASAAEVTGLPPGVPVVSGTIDAWSEGVSVGAHRPGDLMLMYGTTMFIVNTVASRVDGAGLWSTVGAYRGTRSIAGGMATSGAITSWLRELVGAPDWTDLLAEAASSGPGARGLLMLPYFAGERTPIADPDARGVIAGLTVEHTRGDLYRAALESTAMGVRHNVEAIRAAGGAIERVVAVGGGTAGGLWTQIVSDVTGLTQEVPAVTIGASFGAAFLAASAVADVHIDTWNPTADVVEPGGDPAQVDAGFDRYRRLYRDSLPVVHELARL